MDRCLSTVGCWSASLRQSGMKQAEVCTDTASFSNYIWAEWFFPYWLLNCSAHIMCTAQLFFLYKYKRKTGGAIIKRTVWHTRASMHPHKENKWLSDGGAVGCCSIRGSSSCASTCTLDRHPHSHTPVAIVLSGSTGVHSDSCWLGALW